MFQPKFVTNTLNNQFSLGGPLLGQHGLTVLSVRGSLVRVLSRPPQDVDVLVVLDFKPKTRTLGDEKNYGNENLKSPGRQGRRQPAEPWF